MSNKDKNQFATALVVFVFVALSLVVIIFSFNLSDKALAKKNHADCVAHPLKEARIDNVVRVFMHLPGSYSVMTEDPSTHNVSVVNLNVSYPSRCGSAKLVADAPADRPMWVDLTPYKDAPCNCESAVIHIHAAREVNGADWEIDHGGKEHHVERGTTEVVE